MPKCRIIGVVIAKGDWAVQSRQFRRHLPIGRTSVVVDYLNRWGIDEIALLDMDASKEGRGPLFDAIHECARLCRVPLAVGGGLSDLPRIEQAFRIGADKVVLNTAALANPGLVTEAARRFGDQAIIVSIDVQQTAPGRYEVIRLGREKTGRNPFDYAKQAVDMGAGELLVNSVDRDGMKQGYDLELLRRVTDLVPIPVIACGGVGRPGHFLEAFEAGITSVAAANYFSWCEHSVALAKRYLASRGARVRHETLLEYEELAVNDSGRLAEMDEGRLQHLRFKHIEEEVI